LRPDDYRDDELLDDWDPKKAFWNPKELTHQFQYRLKCIVHHKGSTPTSGHYITDSFNPSEKKWYRHDDTVVREEGVRG